MLKVYAPASIGNVGVGFDILGAAVTPIDGALLGDCVSVERADQFTLRTIGRFAGQLPERPEENLVWQCWQRFSQALGQPCPVALTLEKHMPVGSGLGSSACSIVATLMALNLWYDKPFSDSALLQMMGEMEGQVSGGVHYDNVAPCFLGGLQLILDTPTRCEAVPGFAQWYWVMAYPGIRVSTAQARAVLPDRYSRADCVAFGRYLAGFLHACHTGQSHLAASMMHDVLAEPYRTVLLPGFEQARQAVGERGALACGISGSGPTLFAICDQPEQARQVADWLHHHYLQTAEGFVHICRLDTTGARQVE